MISQRDLILFIDEKGKDIVVAGLSPALTIKLELFLFS